MRVVLSMCAALVLTLPPQAFAQQEEEEATPDCASVCQAFPSQAPPECSCTVIGTGTGGSTPIDYDNLTASDVIELEQAAYQERMAGIQDYWIIEHSNIAPLPTIIYYQKNPAGASPPYRQVPRLEVEKLQIEQNPHLTADQKAISQAVAADPAAMLEGIAQAADLFGEALAGELPFGGAALEAKSDEVAAGFLEAADSVRVSMAEMAEEQADQFDELAAAMAPLFKGGVGLLGIYAPVRIDSERRYYVEEDDWEGRFPTSGLEPNGRTYVERDDWDGLMEDDTDAFAYPCIVAAFRGPVDVTGGDGEVYTIESAERWVLAYDGLPIYVRMVVRRGFQRVVVERETSRYGWDAQKRLYYAQQIKDRIGGLSEALPEVKKRIEVGGVNEGVPSKMEEAKIMGENVGTPGADPTGGAQ